MTNNKIKMWRKRYIPNEIVDISSDKILYRDSKLLITKWNVIHPRADFQSGISFILIDDGIKISKFYDENGNLVKIYCDIIEVEYNSFNNEYVFVDLLLDIEILSENQIKILDLNELNEAFRKGLITKKQFSISKKRLKKLINMILYNNFPPKDIIEMWDKY